jgi:histidine triad (HIT) family protein
MADDCIFCKIAQGSIPATFIYQDDEIMAFRDINPHAPVHVLICPRQHITNVAEVTDQTEPLMGRLIKVAADIARQENVADKGFRLLTNNGPEGGQVVMHLHFHLLGGRQMKGLG